MQVPATQRRHVCFGPFEVDVASHELLRDGRKIKLQEMPFQILTMLLDHPRLVVTRDELRQKLWPSDTFVDFEHSINTAIKKLREALEDNATEPQYIETLPKIGYRFIASVAQQSAKPQQPESQPLDQDVARQEQEQSRVKSRWYVVLAVAVGLAGISLLALNLGSVRDRWSQQKAALESTKPIEALAVLPLDNLSLESEQEYFADGLTDALITDLGKIGGLRVISRTSVMTYKKTTKPLSQIARELDVDAVVEGTVLHEGNKTRVTVQLIRVSPEQHLWAERYERNVGEVIQLEKQLALAIAHEVTGRLTTAQEAVLSGDQTTNPKAYDAYLRGRYLLHDRTTTEASQAEAYFEAALREDPNFALAYSGLADYYSVGWGAWLNVPLGESYARKAVALGPDLAEAHASLGIAAQFQCKFAEAGRELQQAIELNPNYAMAHHWYAVHLMALGRVNEALVENDRARRLDPFQISINFSRIQILTIMGQYDQALEQLEVLATLAPISAHRQRANIYWAQGSVPEAIVEERGAAQFDAEPGRPPAFWDEVGRAYDRGGTQAAFLKAAQLEELGCAKPSGVRAPELLCEPGMVAQRYATAGDKEKALLWLKRGLDQNRTSASAQCWVANSLETGYASLRSDRRFQEILRNFGLPVS